ncbi:MAG: hypothetical protein ACRD2C_05190 [Acidimicrobiales bacterium]
MRRTVLSVGLALLVGVAAGALANTTTGGGDQADPPTGQSEPEQAQAPPSTAPLSSTDLAGAVEVLETGLTAGYWEYCNGSDPDPTDGCSGCSVARGCGTRPPEAQHLVSYGLTVRNRSDHLFRQIPLTFTFVDDAGQPIEMASAPLVADIGRLLPNETLGLGAIVEVDSGGTSSMTVEVGPPGEVVNVDFARATADVAGLYELTADGVGVSGPGSIDPERRPTEWTVRYELEGGLPEDVTSNPEPIRVYAVPEVVLRDADNRIVGGATGERMEITGPAFGYNELSVHHEGLAFPAIAEATTQVYFTDVSVEGVP